MTERPAVLAVDGGNSKTDVVLASADGTVLGTARGPGSNHQLVGLEAAMAVIDDAVGRACAGAGVDPASRPVAPVGAYCLAGLDFDVDKASLGAAIASRRWSDDHVVANDTFAVWRAGTDAEWGIGVVCGTGINCAGRGPDGATVWFPSLGELSGDLAAGGAWLGVRALGLALRAVDGRGQPSELAALVPAHFDRPDPLAVLEAVYTGSIPYEHLFELARVVLDAAAHGDTVARRAADELADEVVAMVRATVHRLHVEDRRPVVVLGGGILQGREAGFSARVESGIRSVAPGAEVTVLDSAPVVGAALLALERGDRSGSGGRPPTAERRARLRAGLATGRSQGGRPQGG
ncbi:MAG TPA: BadF/BadG/BcrA/BcrD ATPase family protein [Acidimicrobiales bacterium]|nr:BadF/BadG/BcrA/BcrD ATPase family protein [Acidimicrobiales bacterium]